MKKRIQILDCTLRDGGFSLEDAEKNNIPHLDFASEDINKIANELVSSKIDIVELGAIEHTENDVKKFAIYQTIEAISATKPKNAKEQMHAVFFRGPDIPLEEIPEYRDGFCEIARMCLRYSELDKSLDYCKGLAEKGYKVFIQPMLTMRYSMSEIDKIIDTANEIAAYALYFVDSYGCMNEEDVKRLFLHYDARLNENVRIGFHSHNNMNLAFSNVLSFIKLSGKRNIVIDSCCMGMGQGAGNMQTELLIPYLNENCNEEYLVGPVLNVCDLLEKYRGSMLWGYSPTTLIPAISKTAYKYAIVLKSYYGYSLAQIYEMLNLLPEELRYRYTLENVCWLIDEYEGKKELLNK